MSFERARRIADAVLMEGYALYPYRASAPKNRFRWSFGVLAPRAWSQAGGCERWWMQAQVLAVGGQPRIRCELRAFQIERRRVRDARGAEFAALDDGNVLNVRWDEGLL